jgi:hypothetical protein
VPLLLLLGKSNLDQWSLPLGSKPRPISFRKPLGLFQSQVQSPNCSRLLEQVTGQALLPERSKLDNVRNVRQSNIGACIHRLTAAKIAGSFGQ